MSIRVATDSQKFEFSAENFFLTTWICIKITLQKKKFKNFDFTPDRVGLEILPIPPFFSLR